MLYVMNEKLYNKLKQIANKMCSDVHWCEDLFQEIMLQLQTNERYNSLPEKAKVYYFVGIIRNQVYSNNSSYFRKFKKHSFIQPNESHIIIDNPYVDSPDMDFVKNALELELKDNPDFWYDKMLFELWLEKKCIIEQVHQKTKIPRYSIKDSINKTKQILKKRWEDLN
jgi:lysozyme family protein